MRKKRIVIKVGSSTITHASGLLNLRKLDALACVLSDLRNQGHEVLLVSSGAIAAGRGKMHLDRRPQTLEEKQALAAVGQCELMYIYDKMFSQYSCSVAQLLITKEVIDDDTLRRNVRGTIDTLLAYRCIPIINENDSVATDEIVYGDNDTLSAITARLMSADLLILLSDVDGLYERNPLLDPKADVVRQRAAICLHLQVRARVKGQGADLCDDIFPDLERRLVDAGADPYLDRPRIEAFSLDQPRDGMMRDLFDRPGPSGVDGDDDAAVRIVQ